MKTRDIVIITLCTIAALVCIALTFWGNIKNDGILTTDSYIGVVATLIGVCATIVVGFQIASFIRIHETERQIKEVQNERDKMREEKEKLYKNINSIQTLLSNALAAVSHNTNNNFDKILTMMMAICCDKEMDSPKVVLSRYKGLFNYIQKANSSELLKVVTYIESFKTIDIPKDIEYYTEIMKLHIEIIEILENVAKENVNETTETSK